MQKKEKKTLKDLKASPSSEMSKKERNLPSYINTERVMTIEAKAVLTIDEKNASANELAHKQKQLEQIEKDRKDRMASFKAQLDETKAQIAELSNKVTLGYEYRNFRCNLDIDFVKKIRIFKEVDTGEVVDTRAIDPDDYQMRIPL